ncbi:MAG: RNA 2',3'-cyclic phosphodiesterase, partial [Ignavibacteriae bacterium]|nr:RNA 2',3'-cyclic phosphodiesterase [Ignavibacteriota bacterium]
MAALRLFIGIAIPAEIRSQISEVVRELKSANANVRWEQIDKLHITMKFLGDTPDHQVPSIVTALESLATKVPAFRVTYSGVGCFPNKREPRIIWVGVDEGNSVLVPLAESIDALMTTFGFEKEDKRFHPHVTIGRVKNQHNMRDLLRTMESITFVSHPTTISELALVKSE